MAFSGWASQYYKNPLKNGDDETNSKDSSKPNSSTSSMSAPRSGSVQRTSISKDPEAQAKSKARQAVLKRKFASYGNVSK